MHERLCDPKVQLSLGQNGPRYWNVLLVYSGRNRIDSLGFGALTCSGLSALRIPGIERIETRQGIAAVSLRGTTELARPAVIKASHDFYQASHMVLASHETERRVLREAYLLGDRVEGIKEKISCEDILADVLGLDFEVALPTDEAL